MTGSVPNGTSAANVSSETTFTPTLPEASAPGHPMQEQHFVLAFGTSAVHVDENLSGDAVRDYAGAGCCSLR